LAPILVQLLPLILGAVLAPLWIVLVLLLLASPRGLAKTTAFVGGMTLTRLVQGVVFGVILRASPDAKAENGGDSPIVSTLLLVVGLLLLIAAFRKWRKQPDPDDPPPGWMESISGVNPLKALGMGALLVAIGPKLWVFTLSALGVIVETGPGLPLGIATYLAYILLAQSVLIVSVLGCALAPKTAARTLQQAIGWLTRYSRPISVTASLVFGLYFTWGGIKGLLS
jgi:threonine/homoserine/homoserine lactone efflux protein